MSKTKYELHESLFRASLIAQMEKNVPTMLET